MEKITWTIERKKVADLKAWEQNPRSISKASFEKLKNRIVERGFHDVIKIDTDGTILSGNQRKKALTELNVEEVYCLIPDRALSEQERQSVALESNRNDGEWDWDLLTNFDISLLSDIGFSAKELAANFNLDVEDDDFDLEEELRKDPVAKRGEIYQLGQHRIMCGDSTSKEDVTRLMRGNRADMVFTDPPYNVDYQGGMNSEEQNKREGIMNDKMSRSEFYQFLLKVCHNVIQFSQGACYICMSSNELDSLKKAFEEAGGHWQTFIIWVKSNFTLSRSDYQHAYEPILYGWPKNIVNHYFIDNRTAANVWEDLKSVKTDYDGTHTTISFQGFKVKLPGKIESGEVIRKKQHTNIWRYDKPTKSVDHPTMKPLELCGESIKNSSVLHGIVLDLFLGSGSTLIAAEQLKRTCYGMELDPKYIDVIIARWEKLTGLKATKDESR